MSADTAEDFAEGDLVLGPAGRAARVVRTDATLRECTVEYLSDESLATFRWSLLRLVERGAP